MNIENIKSLAEILEKSNLTAIEVKEKDTEIRLERNIVNNIISASVAQPDNQVVMTSSSAPVSNQQAQAVVEKTDEIVIDFNNVIEIKSPIVGVFYSAASPDSPPFVKRGSKIKKGDVLCIIEAMKVMNEIVSENDGEIVDVCAQNGQIVEFSQVLFKVI